VPLYPLGPDDPVLDAVDLGVIGVGLDEEGRPVELERGAVLLCVEDGERAPLDDLLPPLGQNGLHQAHQRLPLVAVQRVPDEHQSLPAHRLHEPPSFEPARMDWTHSVESIGLEGNKDARNRARNEVR